MIVSVSDSFINVQSDNSQNVQDVSVIDNPQNVQSDNSQNVQESIITNTLSIYNDDKLIKLIKENFNESDNQLFKLSFELYNKTQTKPDDFIINFDDIYTWIGFSTKGNAKTLLTKSFKENLDYKFDEGGFFANAKKPLGGRPSDNILLTIDCFKEFCLIASTDQSRKIYKYYIKMEKIIFKYIQEQYNNQLQEHKKQLQQNKQQLKIKDKQLKENTKELEIKDKQLEESAKELAFIKANFNPSNNLKYDEIQKNQLTKNKSSIYFLLINKANQTRIASLICRIKSFISYLQI